jgi:hypothetical protein
LWPSEKNNDDDEDEEDEGEKDGEKEKTSEEEEHSRVVADKGFPITQGGMIDEMRSMKRLIKEIRIPITCTSTTIGLGMESRK